MSTYEVDPPAGPERGIRVSCAEHGAAEEYDPGQRRVAFFCPDCGVEVEVALHDPFDWRDLGERC